MNHPCEHAVCFSQHTSPALGFMYFFPLERQLHGPGPSLLGTVCTALRTGPATQEARAQLVEQGHQTPSRSAHGSHVWPGPPGGGEGPKSGLSSLPELVPAEPCPRRRAAFSGLYKSPWQTLLSLLGHMLNPMGRQRSQREDCPKCNSIPPSA